MTPNEPDLRVKVRARIAKLEITVTEVARLAGIHPVSASRWINGHMSLGYAPLGKVLAAVGLSLELREVKK